MSEPAQPSFNLIFEGQLRPGTDARRARLMLTAFFGLRDPKAVEGFFRGGRVPLRRNLPRSEAQKLYTQLRSVGLICSLEVVQPPSTSEQTPLTAVPSPKPPIVSVTEQQGSQEPLAAPNTAATSPAGPAANSGIESKIGPQTSPEKEAPPASVTKPAPEPPSNRTRTAFGSGPNLFALRPGTSLRNIAALREATQMRSIIAVAVGLALLSLVAVILFRFPIPEVGARPEGPLAMAALPSNELLLMTSDALLLHERSGIASERIGAAEIGLRALAPPLLALADGDLLLNGIAVESATVELQRCQLEERICSPFSDDAKVADTIGAASSYLNDAYFLLGRDGELRRVASTGEVVASTPVLTPAGVPRVLIEDGLLYMPANEGPLLGVYIPDEARYGTQLDAIFLLAQSQAEMNAVHDFAFVADTRFALLKDSNGNLHLHRFDVRWGGGQAVTVALGPQSYLTPWRDKLLIADPGNAAVRRVSAQGTQEADFESELLREEAGRWESSRRQRQLVKHLGVGLPSLIAVFALFAAVLFQCQHRELSQRQGEATALLDPMPAGIRWIKANPTLDVSLLRVKTALLVAPLIAGIALLMTGAPILLTVASIPALVGAGLAWRNLEVGKGGYLGVLPERIIVVDHEGRYFYGERRLLRGSATAVLAPTACLPLHFPGLRNFEIERKTAAALPAGGQLGRAEIIGGLWRARHPWLLAFLWAAGGWIMAGAIYLALA